MLRMTGGLIVLVDAADFGTVPFHIALNGTKGRAIVGNDGAHLQPVNGDPEHWPGRRDGTTSMHGAVAEIVTWLDEGKTFSAPGEDAVQTLEAIVAFHVSHERNAAWVELPLKGEDRKREVRSG